MKPPGKNAGSGSISRLGPQFADRRPRIPRPSLSSAQNAYAPPQILFRLEKFLSFILLGLRRIPIEPMFRLEQVAQRRKIKRGAGLRPRGRQHGAGGDLHSRAEFHSRATVDLRAAGTQTVSSNCNPGRSKFERETPRGGKPLRRNTECATLRRNQSETYGD